MHGEGKWEFASGRRPSPLAWPHQNELIGFFPDKVGRFRVCVVEAIVRPSAVFVVLDAKFRALSHHRRDR